MPPHPVLVLELRSEFNSVIDYNNSITDKKSLLLCLWTRSLPELMLLTEQAAQKQSV